MTAENTTPVEGENVAESEYRMEEVGGAVRVSGAASVHLDGGRQEGPDVAVVPVGEPSVPEDVQLSFRVGVGDVMLTLSEDDAMALMDGIQQALEVEQFGE